MLAEPDRSWPTPPSLGAAGLIGLLFDWPDTCRGGPAASRVKGRAARAAESPRGVGRPQTSVFGGPAYPPQVRGSGLLRPAPRVRSPHPQKGTLGPSAPTFCGEEHSCSKGKVLVNSVSLCINHILLPIALETFKVTYCLDLKKYISILVSMFLLERSRTQSLAYGCSSSNKRTRLVAFDTRQPVLSRQNDAKAQRCVAGSNTSFCLLSSQPRVARVWRENGAQLKLTGENNQPIVFKSTRLFLLVWCHLF